MNEWQPIESAPTDGTPILGWDGLDMTTVVWEKLGYYWRLAEPGCWAEEDDWSPTHWMPLPDPPSSVREGGAYKDVLLKLPEDTRKKLLEGSWGQIDNREGEGE